MGLPVAVGRRGSYFHKGGGAVAETVAPMNVYGGKGWDRSGADWQQRSAGKYRTGLPGIQPTTYGVVVI